MAVTGPPPYFAPLVREDKFVNDEWSHWFRRLQDNAATTVDDIGILAHLTGDTHAARTITGTSGEIAVTNGNGDSGNPTIGLADNPVMPGSEAMRLPSGTTAERASSPTAGDVRWNESDSIIEWYSGSAWVQAQVEIGNLGKVVQVVTQTSNTSASTTTAIPIDDTIPQNDEGAEYMTQAFTPLAADSTLIIEFIGWGSSSAVDQTIALFKDSGADAIQAIAGAYASVYTPFTLKHVESASSTDARTYKIRFGTSSGTAYMLRNSSGSDVYSTATTAVFTITEIAA